MSTFQKIIWVGPNQLLFSLHSTGEPKIHVVLITYLDIFTMDEAKSLVGSADRTPVGVFTQKYLNHSQYGIGSGKAEEIKDFVKEYKKQTR